MQIDPSEIAREQLAEGEQLLWCGKTRADWLTFGGFSWFSVLYAALAVIHWLDREYILASMWSLLAIVRLRTYGHTTRLKKTVYAVTDRRVFMMISDKPDSLRSFRDVDVTKLRIDHERSDGFGDLVFERIVRVLAYRNTRTYEVRFRAIPKVREVDRLICETFAPNPLSQ